MTPKTPRGADLGHRERAGAPIVGARRVRHPRDGGGQRRPPHPTCTRLHRAAGDRPDGGRCGAHQQSGASAAIGKIRCSGTAWARSRLAGPGRQLCSGCPLRWKPPLCWYAKSWGDPSAAVHRPAATAARRSIRCTMGGPTLASGKPAGGSCMQPLGMLALTTHDNTQKIQRFAALQGKRPAGKADTTRVQLSAEIILKSSALSEVMVQSPRNSQSVSH